MRSNSCTEWWRSSRRDSRNEPWQRRQDGATSRNSFLHTNEGVKRLLDLDSRKSQPRPRRLQPSLARSDVTFS